MLEARTSHPLARIDTSARLDSYSILADTTKNLLVTR